MLLIFKASQGRARAHLQGQCGGGDGVYVWARGGLGHTLESVSISSSHCCWLVSTSRSPRVSSCARVGDCVGEGEAQREGWVSEGEAQGEGWVGG